jgi:hypothetical protein
MLLFLLDVRIILLNSQRSGQPDFASMEPSTDILDLRHRWNFVLEMFDYATLS